MCAWWVASNKFLWRTGTEAEFSDQDIQVINIHLHFSKHIFDTILNRIFLKTFQITIDQYFDILVPAAVTSNHCLHKILKKPIRLNRL